MQRRAKFWLLRVVGTAYSVGLVTSGFVALSGDIKRDRAAIYTVLDSTTFLLLGAGVPVFLFDWGAALPRRFFSIAALYLMVCCLALAQYDIVATPAIREHAWGLVLVWPAYIAFVAPALGMLLTLGEGSGVKEA